MARNKNIKINGLAAAIHDTLQEYAEAVEEDVDKVSQKAADDLVQKTKATAPTLTGSYRGNITSKKQVDVHGTKYVWCVDAPDYRLTHLLVHGHAPRDGGRTKKDPFLQNALKTVLLDYEQNLQEAIKNAK